jgi:hypothetical protein
MSINTLSNNPTVISGINSSNVLTNLQGTITPYFNSSSVVSSLNALQLYYITQSIVPTLATNQHMINFSFYYTSLLAGNADVSAYIAINGTQASLTFTSTTSGVSHKESLSGSYLHTSVGSTPISVALVVSCSVGGATTSLNGVLSVLANV